MRRTRQAADARDVRRLRRPRRDRPEARHDEQPSLVGAARLGLGHARSVAQQPFEHVTLGVREATDALAVDSDVDEVREARRERRDPRIPRARGNQPFFQTSRRERGSASDLDHATRPACRSRCADAMVHPR
jgi:hypothetical protein